MARLDIKIDIDKDLLIQNGDFVYDDATLDQASSIIQVSKGEFRQYPLIGVGITEFIGSNIDKTTLYNLMRNNLISDGLVLDDASIEFEGNDVTYNIKVKEL